MQHPRSTRSLFTETLVVNGEGKPVEGDAFTLDVLKQYKDWKAGVVKLEQIKYPVYKGERPGRSVVHPSHGGYRPLGSGVGLFEREE